MLTILEFWLYGVAAACMLFSSISDIKKLEVPDFSSYFMISFGLGARLIYSIIFGSFIQFLDGILGLAFFSGMGLLMYYLGQWGGGDTKITMGFGAIAGLGIKNSFFPILTFIVMLVSGAVLGIFYSLYNYLKNFKESNNQILNMLRKNRPFEIIIWATATILALILLILKIFNPAALLLLAVIIILYYLAIWLSAVQEVSMIKLVSPKELVEGDWLVEDIKVKGKVVVKKSRTGIEKKDIDKIIKLYKKGSIKKVKVKYGMPFVPSFFIGLLLSLLFKNNILAFLRALQDLL
ncbi:MAG: A24 family peptidase [Candidatus Woesearchaeota archaeon]